MIRETNHTGTTARGKASVYGKGPRAWRGLLLGSVLLLSAGCRAASSKGGEAIPEGLPPVMRELRVTCREIVRARVIDQAGRLPPLAVSLEEASARLLSMTGESLLSTRAESFAERVSAFQQVLSSAKKRFTWADTDPAFGRVVDGCLACHLEFRGE